MILQLTESFQADVRSLEAQDRARLLDALLALPDAFRSPDRHSGLGLRKIHASGIWEARVGLQLRLVLGLERNTAVLLRAGSHQEISRYLRRL